MIDPNIVDLFTAAKDRLDKELGLNRDTFGPHLYRALLADRLFTFIAYLDRSTSPETVVKVIDGLHEMLIDATEGDE